MLFRRLFQVLVVFIFTVALIGCSSDDKGADEEGTENSADATEDELHVALYSAPATLDQPMDTGIQSRDIGRLMFETLVTNDSAYKPVPMLADSIDVSEDGLSYTFKLRQGVEFHNGKEMKAEDVVASMDRWMEKSTITGNIFNDAVWTEEDEYTVVLQLAKPSSLTLDTLASSKQAAAIMPKEIVEAAPAEGVEEYIGTGPFKFVEWKQDQYIHFEKYDEYSALEDEPDGLAGKREALVQDIYVHIVTDASTRLAGLKTGEYDIAYQIPNDDYEQIANDENVEPYPATHGELMLVYNKGEGLVTDPKMRQAINAALDMDEIMLGAVVTEDLYWLSPGYMHKDIEAWNSEAGIEYYNQADPDKAKQLLDEAGYNGETLTIISTRDDDVIYNSSVVIQQQLKEIGIEVELEVYDMPTMFKMREDLSTWNMFITGSSVVSTPPQLLALSPTWGGGVNDDKILEQLSAIETSESQEEAKQIWDDIQQYAWEEHVPVSILGGYSMFHAASAKVEGFTTFSGAIFWNTKVNK
ncbi:ABC transporter substrate-binding protein [Ornithinibacillus sp. 4-3]|uniref:ABC transporter substrate-binding protein n=1 Tax=Ornithinibacillus sp. 4-3 TaxID=3231488 RepID=A0AB39HPS1_9BACI